MRKFDKNHGIGSVVWFLGFASLFTLPFALYFGFSGLENVLISVLGLGVISTGIAYFFYNVGLEKIEAEIGGVITMIVSPVVAIVLAVLFIGESLTFNTIFGGMFLILAGLFLNLAPKFMSKFLVKSKI